MARARRHELAKSLNHLVKCLHDQLDRSSSSRESLWAFPKCYIPIDLLSSSCHNLSAAVAAAVAAAASKVRHLRNLYPWFRSNNLADSHVTVHPIAQKSRRNIFIFIVEERMIIDDFYRIHHSIVGDEAKKHSTFSAVNRLLPDRDRATIEWRGISARKDKYLKVVCGPASKSARRSCFSLYVVFQRSMSMMCWHSTIANF